MTEREISRERLALKLLPGLLVKRSLTAVQLGVGQIHQVRFRLQVEPDSKVLKGAKAYVEKMASPFVCCTNTKMLPNTTSVKKGIKSAALRSAHLDCGKVGKWRMCVHTNCYQDQVLMF